MTHPVFLITFGVTPIAHPASRILHPASRIHSCIPHPASCIPHPLLHPASRILHPASCIPHPHPASCILHPASPHPPRPPMTTHYLACDLGAESGRLMLGSLSEEKLAMEEIHRFPNTPIKAGDSLHWNIPRLFAELQI